MADFPRYAIYFAPAPGSALDRFGAQLLGYDACHRRCDLAFPDDIVRTDAGLARADRGSPQIRLSRHAEGADVAGARQDRGRACLPPARLSPQTPRPIPVIRPVVDSISGFIAVIPARAAGELDRLAADCVTRVRHVPRAAHGGGSCAAKSLAIDAAAARISRSLGISLCHGRISLPHDADRPARRNTPRRRARDAAGTVCRNSVLANSPSTASRCSGRTTPRCVLGSSGIGNCTWHE